MKKEIKKKLKDNSTTFEEFYNYLQEKDLGDWDSVNSEDIIKEYVSEMTMKGIHVSHILEALENNSSSQELYSIWLGNSMETPEPINTKQDLITALSLEGEC